MLTRFAPAGNLLEYVQSRRVVDERLAPQSCASVSAAVAPVAVGREGEATIAGVELEEERIASP